MDEFKKEVSEISTEDIALILEEQIDLYTAEELEILGAELNSRDPVLDEQLEKYKILNSHMLTTGYDFCGYTIKKYVRIVSGETVLGTGFLSELGAKVTDFLGVESDNLSKKLEVAKTTALEKLIRKSIGVGGNAIIGVDFDYINFSSNMIGVVANGTSVIIEKNS